MNEGTNLYPGEYQSAIARSKKILIAAGFPWSVTKGVYHPFANEQTTSRGVRVTRIGCSETVSVDAWGYHYGGNSERETSHWIRALAIATLREAGLPYDDRGRLDCGLKAQRKLEALKVKKARGE